METDSRSDFSRTIRSAIEFILIARFCLSFNYYSCCKERVPLYMHGLYIIPSILLNRKKSRRVICQQAFLFIYFSVLVLVSWKRLIEVVSSSLEILWMYWIEYRILLYFITFINYPHGYLALFSCTLQNNSLIIREMLMSRSHKTNHWIASMRFRGFGLCLDR